MLRPLTARTAALLAVAFAFTVAFVVLVVPPLITQKHGNVIAGLGAGFVNPFATGYALDIFASYTVLLIWVVHEARVLGVRRGWIALVLAAAPGVAVGLVAYLLIRGPQVRDRRMSSR